MLGIFSLHTFIKTTIYFYLAHIFITRLNTDYNCKLYVYAFICIIKMSVKSFGSVSVLGRSAHTEFELYKIYDVKT